MENKKVFHDTVSSNGTYIGVRVPSETSHPTLESIFRMMRKRGWFIQTDQRVLKDYPTIAKDYFEGRKGDLFFESHRYPTGFEIEFYQDKNTINKNGGRYDFSKLKLMPYLIRCSFLVELNYIKELLLDEDYIDNSEPVIKTSYEKIMHRIKSCWHYKDGKELPEYDLPEYNCTDKDGKRIRNGQVKYFRDHKGRLQKGTVYHNINNMWWTIINKYEYTNIADFELFDLDSEENRARKYIKPSGLHNSKARLKPSDEQYEAWRKEIKKGGVIKRIELANDFLNYLYEIDWITHKYEFYVKDNGRLGMFELENRVWGNHKVFDNPEPIKLYSKRLPMSSTESGWIVGLRNYVTSGKTSLSNWFCKDSNGYGSTRHKWPDVREKAWRITALAI